MATPAPAANAAAPGWLSGILGTNPIFDIISVQPGPAPAEINTVLSTEQQALPNAVGGIIAGAVAFVFTAAGNFITHFIGGLISGLQYLSGSLVLGLLVAAVVVFVLFR